MRKFRFRDTNFAKFFNSTECNLTNFLEIFIEIGAKINRANAIAEIFDEILNFFIFFINFFFVFFIFFSIRKKFLTWKIYLILGYKSVFDCGLGLILIAFNFNQKESEWTGGLIEKIFSFFIFSIFLSSEILEFFLTFIIFFSVANPFWFSIKFRKFFLNFVTAIILIVSVGIPIATSQISAHFLGCDRTKENCWKAIGFVQFCVVFFLITIFSALEIFICFLARRRLQQAAPCGLTVSAKDTVGNRK